jgi:hypothetical protein
MRSTGWKQSSKMTVHELLWASRVFILVVTIELSVRYFLWWLKTGGDVNRLRLVFMGVSLTAFSLFYLSMMLWVADHGRIMVGPLAWIRFFGDLGVGGGMFLCLISCWRISNGWSRSRIAWEGLVRVTLSLAIVVPPFTQWLN